LLVQQINAVREDLHVISRNPKRQSCQLQGHVAIAANIGRGKKWHEPRISLERVDEGGKRWGKHSSVLPSHIESRQLRRFYLVCTSGLLLHEGKVAQGESIRCVAEIRGGKRGAEHYRRRRLKNGLSPQITRKLDVAFPDCCEVCDFGLAQV